MKFLNITEKSPTKERGAGLRRGVVRGFPWNVIGCYYLLWLVIVKSWKLWTVNDMPVVIRETKKLFSVFRDNWQEKAIFSVKKLLAKELQSLQKTSKQCQVLWMSLCDQLLRVTRLRGSWGPSMTCCVWSIAVVTLSLPMTFDTSDFCFLLQYYNSMKYAQK